MKEYNFFLWLGKARRMQKGLAESRLFQKSLQLFQVNKEFYPDSYRLIRAQLALGFLLFYGVAWGSYVVLYLSLGNVLSALSCALFGLPSALWGLWILRRHHLPQDATLLANFGGSMVLVGITASTGAAASPIYAWFFFVTITTFLLNGKKAGYLMALTTSVATCAIIGLHVAKLRLPMGFSFKVGSNLFNFFIAFTYTTAIFTLALVTHIYDSLVQKGLRDAARARDRAREQFNHVAHLLNNMSQAVFVINDSGLINPPVSKYSQEIFGSNIENTSIWDSFYKDIPQNSEVASKISTALSLGIGGDSLQWDEVVDQLPAEVDFLMTATQRKILRCIYRPLFDDKQLITGIMCVIEDVTALKGAERALKRAKEENQRQAQIIEHIVRIGVDRFDGFMMHTASHIQVFTDAMALVQKDRRLVIDSCLRSVHTIKGNARQLGLAELSSRIHSIEQDIFNYVRAHSDENLDSFVVLFGLLQHTRKLVIELRDYDSLLVNFFKVPSAFKNTFVKIIAKSLDRCQTVGREFYQSRSARLQDHWRFQCFFITECLRFFDAPDLLQEWETFVEQAARNFAIMREDEWFKQFDVMSRKIREHEAIATPTTSKTDGLGTLQIASRNIDRIREHIAMMEQEQDDRNLRRGFHDLLELLARLDEVQLETTLLNFLPMIDELSGRFSKQVQLDVETGTTSLHHEMVDILSDAIMHIIRNMIDHGLESPEARKNLGKNPVGTIRVIAKESDRHLQLYIADDGAGIDTERLLRKAMQRGLIAPNVQLTQEDIIQLIFVPSLSTKDVETEVSGRGYGMEAVRAAVQELGGKIQVESRRGQGTSFRILIPLVSSASKSEDMRAVS